MLGNEPKVSIIMGIYNCEDTLNEALDSIVTQTYTNWELIMCDDCSSDNTFKVAKKYRDKYPDKIKLIRNDINLTLAPTLNRCIELVSGKYIARQDGDDISDKNRLIEQVRFLEENSEYDLVGTNMISFDSTGEKGVHRLRSNPTKNDLIKYGVTFSHATILIKTHVMKKLNGYSDKWYAVQAEDYELWSRFFEGGFNGFNLDKNLYYVREDMETYKRKNIKRRLRGFILRFRINRRLHAKAYEYIFFLKDVIALIIPRRIFIKYYNFKIREINNGEN